MCYLTEFTLEDTPSSNSTFPRRYYLYMHGACNVHTWPVYIAFAIYDLWKWKSLHLLHTLLRSWKFNAFNETLWFLIFCSYHSYCLLCYWKCICIIISLLIIIFYIFSYLIYCHILYFHPLSNLNIYTYANSFLDINCSFFKSLSLSQF